MFPALPKHHPPLKGCLNALTFTEVSVSIFDSWGPGAASTFTGTASFTYDIADMEFVNSIRPESFSYRKSHDLIYYLPLHVQDWFNTVISGSWVYLVRNKLDAVNNHAIRVATQSNSQEFVFFFQHEEDLMLFKLSW
jgi:hypothetical protein